MTPAQNQRSPSSRPSRNPKKPKTPRPRRRQVLSLGRAVFRSVVPYRPIRSQGNLRQRLLFQIKQTQHLRGRLRIQLLSRPRLPASMRHQFSRALQLNIPLLSTLLPLLPIILYLSSNPLLANTLRRSNNLLRLNTPSLFSSLRPSLSMDIPLLRPHHLPNTTHLPTPAEM
jgi:hypothetical protein